MTSTSYVRFMARRLGKVHGAKPHLASAYGCRATLLDVDECEVRPHSRPRPEGHHVGCLSPSDVKEFEFLKAVHSQKRMTSVA